MDHLNNILILTSSDLKWSKHIKSCISKANSMIAWVTRNLIIREINVMRNVYKTIIRPHLEYCAQLWSPPACHGNWATIIELDIVEHTKNLKRSLSYATATINRIKDNLPDNLHKELYFTLFESHLSYCISVWGGAAQCHLTPIWMSQKHCIRILFGDKEAYLNKFKTCVRARPVELQALGTSFYEREHTKPLFKLNNILCMHNLYTYHSFMEAFKILKLRLPTTLYSEYHLAHNRHTRLITPSPSSNFLYKSSLIWNKISQKLKITDFSANISLIKNQLKKALFHQQHIEQTVQWTPEDFNFDKIKL